MAFPNSHLADPSTYDTALDGLAANIPLRISRSAALVDRGAFRAQKDWQQIFSSLPSPDYAGTAAPQYGFVSACVPEALPDRAELVGYVVELTFLIDDVMDDATSPAGVAAAPYMADLMRAHDMTRRGAEADAALVGGSPVARLLVAVRRAMLAVDPGRARDAFRWLETWVKAVLTRPRGEKEIGDLDDYLEYRRSNVASQAVFGLMIFAMGFAIPEDQQHTCLEISKPLWLQLSLANDYHSWEREQKTASNSGQESVTNAIWVLINKHSMSCDEAKRVCRDKASQYAAEYVRVVEAAKASVDLCDNAKLLLERMKFAISGNIAWGLQCPRYHDHQPLTAAQLEMAETVRAGEAMSWICGQETKATDSVAERPKANNNGVITNCIAANGNSFKNMEVLRDVPALNTDTLAAPSRYIDSLPGKGVRDKAITALNVWYKVPSQQIAVISKVVRLLHGASLMLDDIEDSSQLRRGKPAAHMVFGTMQTINSAGFRFLSALEEVRRLGSQRCMDVFCQELQELYVGQSHDLAWTRNLSCPTEEEYLAMVDGKTAGLFRMLARLLDALSDSPTKPEVTVLTRFMTLLGRSFQIRDDYMNLISPDYTKQKGFCEDLDEGKYSLPLIHALGRSGAAASSDIKSKPDSHTAILQNLLSQRQVAGKMTVDQKTLFLEHLEQTGGLEYTRRALGALQCELDGLGNQMGMRENKDLADLLDALKV